jgi:uncharacterized membrane protein YczE
MFPRTEWRTAAPFPAARAALSARVDPRPLLRFAGGLGIAAFGMTLMLRTDLGAAPWEVLVGGIAGLVGSPPSLVRYGVVVALIAAAMLLGARVRVALVVTGFVGATWMALLDLVVPHVDGLGLRVVVFAAGLAVMGFGIAVYLHAGLGAGPHDALIEMVAVHSRRSLVVARTGCETGALVAGIALGGVFGLGTVAFALGLGPLIAVSTTQLDRHLSRPAA